MWTRTCIAVTALLACAVCAAQAAASIEARYNGSIVTRTSEGVYVGVAIDVGEQVDFLVRIKRAGKVLGKQSRHVQSGKSRQLDVALPEEVTGGRVTVMVVLTAENGERRRFNRTARIPK